MDAPRARGVPPTPARAVAALALACCCGLLRAAVPVPTPAQLRLAQRGYGSPSTGAVPTMGSPLLPGLTMFQHFGPCTFATTGYHTNHTCQWDIQSPLGGNSGPAVPRSVAPASHFNPVGLSTDQWMETAKQLGASQVCLTVRHVDGFALWPTAVNNYSVASSPWKGGKGDVVKEFVGSARKAGISPCFYIILGFDVYSNQSGVGAAEYLQQQEVALTELLTNYGRIDRLWWDNYAIGCCQPVTHAGFFCEGGGTQARNVSTSGCPNWSAVIDTVRKLSPHTAIVPGPDGCLVNGEVVGGTYPLYTTGPATGGSYHCAGARGQFTAQGVGNRFVVSESDYSFVTGNWFWNPGIPYMNAAALWEQFTLKYGQGANLILNVPPNSSGLVPDEYIAQLRQFNATRMGTYGTAVAELAAPITAASCAELSFTVHVDASKKFDQVVTMEDLGKGQQITAYSIEVAEATAVTGDSSGWRRLKLTAGHGATVGARVVDWGLGTLRGVTALRWNCSSARTSGPITIAHFGAYLGHSSGGAKTEDDQNQRAVKTDDDGTQRAALGAAASRTTSII